MQLLINASPSAHGSEFIAPKCSIAGEILLPTLSEPMVVAIDFTTCSKNLKSWLMIHRILSFLAINKLKKVEFSSSKITLCMNLTSNLDIDRVIEVNN